MSNRTSIVMGLIVVFALMALSGCATTRPPRCDGSNKKPINTARVDHPITQDVVQPALKSPTAKANTTDASNTKTSPAKSVYTWTEDGL
ncbi:hypothetical protein [Sulfurirhabdus autotrophica]|nr:hypothetical protein [Sulfurirhabdus autotrophica]